jgi:hypothetical protein
MSFDLKWFLTEMSEYPLKRAYDLIDEMQDETDDAEARWLISCLMVVLIILEAKTSEELDKRIERAKRLIEDEVMSRWIL